MPLIVNRKKYNTGGKQINGYSKVPTVKILMLTSN